MRKKIYLISRIYKPFYFALEKFSLKHTGIPAYYNFIKHVEKDDRFDVEIIFLLDESSSKKFKSGKYNIKGIKSKVRLVKYFSLLSSHGITKKMQWSINRLFQYSFLFFLLKKNSVYYLDRDNLLLGNILALKKGVIVYRLLGVTKKFYNIFFNKGFLSNFFLRALKLKDKIIISTNDGSWAEQTKKKLDDENFYLMFNGCDLTKKKIIPQIKNELNIICISRLELDKGYLEFLNILYMLKNRFIKFKVIIIGDGSLKEKVIKRIKDLGLINNVEIKGNLEHYKIEEFLERSDLFVSYNYLGMFGNNVIEATSKGIPVIALDNNVLESSYKKYFHIIKKDSLQDTIEFIIKFSTNLDLRKKYSDLSMMFFDQYIGNWNQRIKKELDIIYEKCK